MTQQPRGGPARETYAGTRWLAKCRAIEAFDIRLDRPAQVAGTIPRAVTGNGLQLGGADPHAGCGGDGSKKPRQNRGFLAERRGLASVDWNLAKRSGRSPRSRRIPGAAESRTDAKRATLKGRP